MSVKLLIEQHLEFLSLKEAAQARLSLQLSKFHIVGTHMSRSISFADNKDVDQHVMILLKCYFTDVKYEPRHEDSSEPVQPHFKLRNSE